MKAISYLLCSLVGMALLLASCDDGRIPETVRDLSEKGRVARLDAEVDGLDTWPKGYTVAFAGFTNDGQYAEISKDVRADANGRVSLTLPGIPDDVTKLEVCVINSIRKRVITLYSAQIVEEDDTIRIRPESKLNVGAYAALQSQLFDKQCAHCHSGSAWAASLNLNEGHSYANLVNVASQKEPGRDRVTPGNSAESVLYEALSTSVSDPDHENWKFDHSKIMETSRELLELVKEWIDGGAKE